MSTSTGILTGIILGVVICGLIVVLTILIINSINIKNERDEELEVGDVILSKLISNNPFEDYENKYETVKEVKKNDKGETYFMSYTSDIDGNPSPEQNAFSSEHTYGKWFWKEDWKKVNHIETLKN